MSLFVFEGQVFDALTVVLAYPNSTRFILILFQSWVTRLLTRYLGRGFTVGACHFRFTQMADSRMS